MAYEILIASDSHGRSDLLEKIEQAYPNAFLYLHCGDLEDNPGAYPNWVFVKGNNDWTGDMPYQKILRLSGHTIWMLHSDHFRYNNRNEALAAEAKRNGADIVLYGHTHCSFDQFVNGIHEINPGSLWLPRDGKEPSYARMIIEDDGTVKSELIYQPDWPFDPSRKKNKKDKDQKEKKRRWFW